MEALLQTQRIIADAMVKIKVNFNKDSKGRKTADYIKKRRDNLEDLWDQFQQNHYQLLEFEDQKDEYFTSDAYSNVKKGYETTRDLLVNFVPVTTEERGIPSKTDELISQQDTNFRALSRLVRNINFDQLTEKWEIEDKIQAIQSRWKLIDDIHWQIDSLLETTNLAYEQEFAQHEAIFEASKRKLNQKLNASAHQFRAVPPIDIPTFSGNYNQWPTFMDLYCEAIHKNSMLTKGQKMQHLKGKLRGEAERIVQHLTVSAENYDSCWEILTHRYNNLQLLFTKQIQTFINQPAIQQQSASELKRLHDTSLETIHAIHNLGIDTTTWDPILVHILSGKLDTDTYTSYMESRRAPRELPVFDELIAFVEGKFTALEPVNNKKTTATPAKQNIQFPSTPQKPGNSRHGQYKRFSPKAYHANTERNCPICKSNHILIYCKTYLDMPAEMKLKTIEQLNICKNCLYSHNGRCASTKRCRVCSKPHHTILHDMIRDTIQETPVPTLAIPNKPSTTRHVNHVSGNFCEVLLATAQLKIRSADGTYLTMRCLLDQGSQINLITEAAAQRLGIQRHKLHATVSGIGSSSNNSNGVVQLVCESLKGDYTFTTDALVMTKVLNNLPNYTFQKPDWPHLHGINLADPDFNISRHIDVLLDAQVYSEIVMGGILRGPVNTPIAQQTRIGWVLLGNVTTFNCHAVVHNLDEITQFWEMEEVTELSNKSSVEEDYCETLYKNTTRRLSDGRYEVKIPMMPDFEKNLGISKPQAVAQFSQLEKRLAKNEAFAEEYKKFIGEYVKLGHMKQSTSTTKPSCFLPHHGVLKLDSTTTKLRVVFNASAKTSTGYSLNQLMNCGPNLQQDLLSMILRWRAYQFVYTADIEKFYRQIVIQEEDQHLQKIVWRDSDTEPIREYQLCTITYGTKAAPYLAMRTIKQLVQDDGHRYPLAANIMDNHLYVDDLLGGSNSFTEAKEAQNQLINMLQGGGFNLRKWASNDSRLLKNLPESLLNKNVLDFKHAETNKTLGITWNPQTDQFTFKHASLDVTHETSTKRVLLSELSQLYDPLGWLSPVTMKGKIIFQQVWMSGVQWDEPLPDEVRKEWALFKRDLPQLQNIRIHRCIGCTQHRVELHGFCDASEKGYSCVIYCKSDDLKTQSPIIKLVAGKTKLAPFKKPLSLPRLELCGAMLLSRLMKRVIESINVQTVNIYGWTDSMVVLGWLQGEPSRWKAFVSNRVTEITSVMPSSCWRHVKSEEIAADCASRGLMPSQILTHGLWWTGPSWLKNNNTPTQETFKTNEEERKIKQVNLTQQTSTFIEELLQKHSSMTHVTRVLSWILRFIENARYKGPAKQISYLTSIELERANICIVKIVQSKHFADDVTHLQTQGSVRSNSKILSLNPTLDQHGILRVGGRLEQADLSQSQKHPIILPNNDKLTELLVNQSHKTTLHGGARLTLNHLRMRFWIVGGMRTVKKTLLKCVRCHRFKRSKNSQLMADLPKPRVTPSRPFTHTGVDFTGHVEIKANKGRGIKITKGYIAVFICLSTKAIHLELVSDLSSACFLAALKRMCARRGTPKHLYSDNGTNFVGAARTLNKEHKDALNHYINSEFYTMISEAGIEWHFNAPSWPTAGGLWEAAVKSMKHHLKRVIGEQRLTFEEFSTLLAQIEACLNSRPLTALTDDIGDLDCLTPGHFLVGGPVLSPPSPIADESKSLTTRWKLTERMHKDFWRRWSAEYLQDLQRRSKWLYPTRNIEIGDIVLVKDELAPPARWLLARVTDTHPGQDGRVRVVTVKTKTTSLKRPITKVSRLPIEQNSNEEEEKSTEDKIEKPKRHFRPRKGTKTFTTYLYTLLTLVAACITPTMQQFVNITALNPAKLLYFDKVADMQIVQDEWKMVVYYNMSSYWQSLMNVERYISHLNSVCTDEPAYKTITSQFEHELNELRHYNDMLQSEHGIRTKRGLINGVGYIANSLFGVLDERFADKYNRDIKLIQNNQNHLLHLYKEHTSLIEGEYNLLKRNEEVMNTQFAIISQHLRETERRIKEDHRNTMYVTATALAANMIISNLRRVQQLLIDLVTDVRNGRVDAHLLRPDEFKDQLNIISGQIPQELSLPCVNSYECIRQMYKLSRVHVRMTQEFLLFEVKIPLINSERYELTRVLPIPNLKGQTITRIVPTTEYLAVNLQKDLMIPLTTGDLTSCVHFSEHELLCSLNIPIYNIKTAANNCEAQIINNEAIRSCPPTVLDCKDDWIVLHGQRSWMFTCCQECTVRVFCPAGITSQTLLNTGTLTLAAGCMLRGEHHVIRSRNSFRSEVKANEEQIYIPESGVNHFINSDNNFTFNHENHEEQLKTIKEHIERVKGQQRTLSLQAEVADAHHYAMYGIVSVAILAIGIWGCLKIRRYLSKIGTRRQSTTYTHNPSALGDSASVHSRHEDGPSKVVWPAPGTRINKATSPI